MMTMRHARLLGALLVGNAEAAAPMLASMDEADWSALLAAADADLLSPELGRRLSMPALAPWVPEEVAVHLDRLRQLNAARNHRIAAQLQEIVPEFGRAGVKLLLLKGAAEFARRPVERVARTMIDLDLLLASDELATAVMVLERLGYRRIAELGSDETHIVGYFGRRGEPALLDLHRHPLVAAHLLPTDALLARAVAVPALGGSVHVPGAADDMLLAVLHGMIQDQAFKYGTFSVRRLRDIAVRLPALRPKDWPGVLGRAEEGRFAAQLTLALNLVGAAFGSETLSAEARAVASCHRARFTEWRIQMNARGRLPLKINALVGGIVEASASYNHRPSQDGPLVLWRMRRLSAGVLRQLRRAPAVHQPHSSL